MKVDLFDELGTALLRLARHPGRSRAWLRQRGVTCGLVGLERIVIEDKLWTPREDGAPAFVFAVLDGPHQCQPPCLPPRDLAGKAVELIDLAAWRPSAPAEIYLREGNADLLGDWMLPMTRTEDAPLRLFADPVEWLATGCGGIVPIDWKATAAALVGFDDVVCSSVALGERLEHELALARRRATPKVPAIGVIEAA